MSEEDKFLESAFPDRFEEAINGVMLFCRHAEKMKKGDGVKALEEIMGDTKLASATFDKMKEAIIKYDHPFEITITNKPKNHGNKS